MTLDVQVPTKIVIMGTSSMSLNDRFSKIKKVVVPAAKQVVRPSRKSLLAAQRQGRSTLALDEDDYEDGLMVDEEMIEEEVYDPTYTAVRRTRNPVIARPRVATIYRNHVPLQDRISFAPQPYRVAPYNNAFSTNRGRAGFRGSYGINRAQNGFRHNPNYGRLNAGFQPRYQNNKNGGFPPRYGRGGARGGFVKKQQPKKSQEELDRELDEYMTKSHPANSKHVPITMDGLE
ncbi:hypothetical protein PRIPAC_84575 [Pristionchus pacificus]|uniref:FoP_duplication domain-containing protein n=1 Tax=Pristionchus pacificus TaxID=54126 RepID=A0A2A6BSB9_PRIPA|nr:hypothetical protein PRIPAC_84575 [Pristionchus pacificus]|eukprot:PDM68852.1 hypothetical protein PRIPAC_47154 [Pristionchus pacificus]